MYVPNDKVLPSLTPRSLPNSIGELSKIDKENVDKQIRNCLEFYLMNL
jgi:hypothetical protein